jgi:hypothetical protein
MVALVAWQGRQQAVLVRGGKQEHGRLAGGRMKTAICAMMRPNIPW